MRAGVILAEVRNGLRRNLTMTLAVVVTVGVSLSLFGAALLVRAQVGQMKDYWYDRVQVSIFLCGPVSEAPSCAGGTVTDVQKQQILSDLDALKPLVQAVYYESQQEALARFKEQFKGSPLAANATVDQMPESYRVKLKDPTKFAVISSAFAGRPGIEDVQDQRQSLDRLFRALGGLQAMGLAIAMAMLFVTVLLISNTMRVASFSRRRETSIMRLVGASNTAIRLPFVLEAASSAFGGGLIASLGLVAIKVFLIDHTLATTFQFTTFIGWGVVLWTVPIVIGVGVLLAVVAASLTLRRYLRV